MLRSNRACGLQPPGNFAAVAARVRDISKGDYGDLLLILDAKCASRRSLLVNSQHYYHKALEAELAVLRLSSAILASSRI
jgi:hypothetical protein